MLRKNKDQELWESKSRWEATLSNGETIYQDDSDGFPSWILLGRYIKENNLKIVNLSFGFRDNTVQLKPNADGYFFRNMATGSIAGTQLSFIIGILEDGVCKVEKWEIPEMQYQGVEHRTIESAGESLIYNV